jgi:hypothetical protein
MASNLGILKGKYPAKSHAKKVADFIIKNGGDPKGVLYLEGQKTRMIEDNDEPCPFRLLPTLYPSSFAIVLIKVPDNGDIFTT